MFNLRSNKVNNQSGSATVEAVVGFTAFLFAIFTILGLVNFCRAQMLISSAVDTAAKEMSQYAYFYEMSGLKKFETAIDENGNKGKANINDIIGTVDNLYGSLNNAVNQGAEDKTRVENMLGAGEVDMDVFENVADNTQNSVDEIMIGVGSIEEAFRDIGNDPLLYMRSIVALMGSGTVEAAKRAVAIPLSRSFVSKHFGENREEANEVLEGLGIEGGIDSMNFNLSTIFSDDKHQDIEITVFYKVKVFNVFDWEVWEAEVSKTAVCRAWLGGDCVYVPPESPAPEEKPSTPEATHPEGTPPEGESGEGEQPGEEEKPATNASTGKWALQHDPTGYNGSERVTQFAEQMYEDYNVDTYAGNYSYVTSSEPTMAYVFAVHPTWTYDRIASGEDMLAVNLSISIKSIAEDGDENNNGELQQFAGITKIVYVPENIPDDQYNDLLRDATNTEKKMKDLAIEKGLPDDFQVNIVVRKDGGTYDYSSSEGDYVNIGGTKE